MTSWRGLRLHSRQYQGDLDPNDAIAYGNRGVSKGILKIIKNQLWTSIRQLNSIQNLLTHFLIEVSKIFVNDKYGGCLDLSKAGELGHPRAYEMIKNYCN